MMDLIIKGSEWLRGEGSSSLSSSLYRPLDSKACCVGLHAIACGIPKYELAHVTTPQRLGQDILDKFPEYRDTWTKLKKNNEPAHEAFDYNDRMFLSDDERIEKLRPIFAKVGVNIIWKPEE